jgi:hypothetical protein
MAENEGVGLLGDYQGGGASRPRQILEMIVRRTELRALMELESRRIAEALPCLNSAETEQLQAMLASEVDNCSADVAELSKQVEAESALSASVKAMDVWLTRESSRILQAEIMARIERNGFAPAANQLVGEAVRAAFSSRR